MGSCTGDGYTGLICPNPASCDGGRWCARTHGQVIVGPPVDSLNTGDQVQLNCIVAGQNGVPEGKVRLQLPDDTMYVIDASWVLYHAE